jgi:hypothetical protein
MEREFREAGVGHLVGDMIPVALRRPLWPLCEGWGRDGQSMSIASTRAAVVTRGQVVKPTHCGTVWSVYPPVSQESLPRVASARNPFHRQIQCSLEMCPGHSL